MEAGGPSCPWAPGVKPPNSQEQSHWPGAGKRSKRLAHQGREQGQGISSPQKSKATVRQPNPGERIPQQLISIYKIKHTQDKVQSEGRRARGRVCTLACGQSKKRPPQVEARCHLQTEHTHLAMPLDP